jgi:MFS family permease
LDPGGRSRQGSIEMRDGPDQDQLGRGRHALPLLCLSQLLVVLDLSVVAVALPSMEADLGFCPGSVSWVMTAYALAYGGALLVGGRAADLVGARRVLAGGLGLFGAASLVGGLAWTPAVLIAARAAQGLGAAAMSPATLSLVTSVFPRSPERERALGVFATMASLGLVTGLLLGGAVTELGWRWVMWLAVPVCAVALAGGRLLPVGRRDPGAGLDLGAATLVTAGAALVVFGLSRAPQHGWISAATIGNIASGLLLVGGFVLVERRSHHPLVPARLFRHREVALVNAALLAKSAFGPAWLFVLTLHFQVVRGLDPLVTGLAFVPLGAGALAAGLLAGRILARAGSLRRGGIAGQLVLVAGILIATPGSEGGLVALLVGTAIGGVGYVVSDVSMTVIATSAAPPDLRGAAAGLLNTSVQIGAALGLGLVGATVSAAADQDGLLAGLRAANLLGAAFAALSAVLLALVPAEAQRGID